MIESAWEWSLLLLMYVVRLGATATGAAEATWVVLACLCAMWVVWEQRWGQVRVVERVERRWLGMWCVGALFVWAGAPRWLLQNVQQSGTAEVAEAVLLAFNTLVALVLQATLFGAVYWDRNTYGSHDREAKARLLFLVHILLYTFVQQQFGTLVAFFAAAGIIVSSAALPSLCPRAPPPPQPRRTLTPLPPLLSLLLAGGRRMGP